MKIQFAHKFTNQHLPEENRYRINSSKIIRNRNLFVSDMPCSYDFKSDLDDYIFYSRINNNVLRIHFVDLNSGQIGFNILTSGTEPHHNEMKQKLTGIVGELINSKQNKEEG